MAIALKEIIESRDRTLMNQLGQLRCPYCSVLLQETITGKRKTRRGYACSDCYYEELGKAIEQHPIVSGRVRRG